MPIVNKTIIQMNQGVKPMSEKIKVLKKNFIARCIFTLIMVLASALLQTYVIQVFINSSNLLSSGFTGLAILINKISNLFGLEFDVSLMIILLNVPVALLCMKSISTKFTIFSSIQFFCVSIFLKMFHFTPLISDVMLNCMLGGVLYGFAILLALKGNASTGGTDFIALYVSNKIGKSIWTQVFVFNCIMLCIFGMLFGWENAGYSILFQYVSTQTVNTFYHRYERVTMQITTSNAEDVVDAYVDHYRHGVTVTPSYGGFSKKRFYLLHTVVSAYEVKDIVYLMRSVDPHLLVNVYKSENFFGGFYQSPMD